MAMKKADVWMPLFIGDYLADTAHLTTLEHGAYMLLIMHAWISDGLLPDDDKRLSRICRLSHDEWKESGEYLRQFFIKTNTGLRHKRIDVELAKAEERANNASAAGKASAAKRAAQRELDRQMSNSSTGVEHAFEQEFNSEGNEKATEPPTKRQRKSNSSPSPSPSVNPSLTRGGEMGVVDAETGEIFPDGETPFDNIAPMAGRRVAA